MNDYKDIKNELLTNHNIDLEDEIVRFANTIDGFKHYGYDLTTLLNHFTSLDSFEAQINSLQGEINMKEAIRDDLQTKIDRLQNQRIFSKQTMDTYIAYMKLDLVSKN